MQSKAMWLKRERRLHSNTCGKWGYWMLELLKVRLPQCRKTNCGRKAYLRRNLRRRNLAAPQQNNTFGVGEFDIAFGAKKKVFRVS